MADDQKAICEVCGEPMPAGEEMFKFHGYSGPCPKPPRERVKVRGVGRDKDDDRTFLVITSAKLTDDDLRSLHDHLGKWRGSPAA
jgi:hypothetical protein